MRMLVEITNTLEKVRSLKGMLVTAVRVVHGEAFKLHLTTVGHILPWFTGAGRAVPVHEGKWGLLCLGSQSMMCGF